MQAGSTVAGPVPAYICTLWAILVPISSSIQVADDDLPYSIPCHCIDMGITKPAAQWGNGDQDCPTNQKRYAELTGTWYVVYGTSARSTRAHVFRPSTVGEHSTGPLPVLGRRSWLERVHEVGLK